MRMRLVRARDAEKRRPCQKEYPMSMKVYCWVPKQHYRGRSKTYSAYELICRSLCGYFMLVRFQDPYFYGEDGSEQFRQSCVGPERSNACRDDMVDPPKSFGYTFNVFLSSKHRKRLLSWVSAQLHKGVDPTVESERAEHIQVLQLKQQYLNTQVPFEHSNGDSNCPDSSPSPSDEYFSDSDDDSDVEIVVGPPKVKVVVDLRSNLTNE